MEQPRPQRHQPRRWFGRTGLPAWVPRVGTQGHDAASEHVVQVYRGGFPARRVAAFLRDGISRGEAAVAIVTPEHRRALAKRLRGAPVTFLDAQETLQGFLVHGHPDRIRFEDTVGQAVRRIAAQGNGRARAFGEMVALLCEHGEPEAAAELERLWNGLGARQPLALLCSYPAWVFSGRSRGHRGLLTALHTHVA